MTILTQSTDVACPYCGEVFELVIDPSVPSQTYIEDCYVCCQPINLTVDTDELNGDIHVVARHENEC